MQKAPKIEYAPVDKLFLDPTNPRLGRKIAAPDLKQEDVLAAMKDWTLDELATSFLESGFWPQEALIVVKETLYGVTNRLVVIEGNRRLAALKLLLMSSKGRYPSSKWRDLVGGNSIPKDLFDDVPYIVVGSRREVSAYLGFRHVTGIKEWNPAEKAEYIAKLIEEEHLTYDEVRKKIGSKLPTVRQNYISYRLLLQMDQQEDISIEHVEDKFSVLYLALRTHGVQQYLQIDVQADPAKAKNPVPKKHLDNLTNFAKWLFGDKDTPPVITDSRQVDNFGKILETEKGIEYLERTPEPRFELAFRAAGIGEQDLLNLINGASDNIKLALSEVHVHKRSPRIQKAVERLGTDALQLLSLFPVTKKKLLDEDQ